MANRLNAPNQFETLSPPWILSQLDTNFVQNQAAWNDSSLGFINGIPTDTGVANAYTITAANLPFGAPSGYNKGMTLYWIPANSNTGASTMTVLPLGSTGIVNRSNIALSGGEIIANKALGMVHDGVNFRIVTPCYLNKQLVNTGNITVECAGYDGVAIFVQMNSLSCALTLAHVAPGIPIVVTFYNNSAGIIAYSLTLTDTSGNNISPAVPFVTSSSGANAINLSNPQNLGSGFSIVLSGAFDQPGAPGFAHFAT